MHTATKQPPASDLPLVQFECTLEPANDVSFAARIHLASAANAAATARRRSTEALRRRAGSHFSRATEILKEAANG